MSREDKVVNFSVDAEQAVRNINRLQLSLEGTESIPSNLVQQIPLTRYQLIEWWDCGLLKTDAYIAFALCFERAQRGASWEFDAEDFIDQWTGPPDEKGKEKRLTDVQVNAALMKLRGLEFARIETGPIQLTLDF